MKKITLLILLISTSFTFAQNVWNFNTTAENWDDDPIKCAVTAPGGFITVSFNEGQKNPSIENQNLGVSEADAATYPVIAITLRQSDYTDGPGHLRFAYPKDDLSGSVNIGYDFISTDNNYHTHYIDLSSANWGAVGLGNETSLKISFKLFGNSNFFPPADSSIDIDKIEFVSEVPLPEKLDYAFETPDDYEGWVLNGKEDGSTVASNELNIDYTTFTVGSNEMIKIDNTSYNVADADTNDYMYVVYKNIPEVADDGVYNDALRFQYKTSTDGYTDNKSMSVNIATNMSGSDAFADVQFDLTGESDWAGTTKSFQFSIKNEAYQASQAWTRGCTTRGTFIIDRIIFSSEDTLSGALATENIEIEDANLTLSPNPVNDMLTIRSSSNIEKVEIYNLLGQRVLSENTSTIDVSSLSKGIYVSKVYLENDSISTKKFIKQ